MKQRILNLLACPECGTRFHLDVFLERQGETMEGKLTCDGCLRQYPVIGGVPRLLPDHLMNTVRSHYRSFFQKYAGVFAVVTATPEARSDQEGYVENTQLVYSLQHTRWSKLHDQQHMLATWKNFFADRIPVDPSRFGGKVGLEAGCGEGRYLLVMSERCGEVVGMDLSEGVDPAFARTQHQPNVHVVQGDILHPPFRRETFDFIYSTGVLHHLPLPGQGFASLAPLLREGAQMIVWVYNLSEANLLYRISHFTALRRVTPYLPVPMQVGLSHLIAIGLQLFAFLSATVATKILRSRQLVPAQLKEVATLPYRWKVKEVHDRIAVPVTNFVNRNELDQWFRENGLTNVEISTKGRGLSAIGTRAA